MPSSPSRSRASRRIRFLILTVSLVGLVASTCWYVGRRLVRSRDREAVARGRDYLQKSRPALAIRAVGRVSEDGPSAAEALEIRGMALALLDRPDEARRALERALELDPKQPMTAKVLAAIYFHANEQTRGFAMLQAAARLDPTDFRPWFGAGDMLRRLNRPADAAPIFEQALRRKPDHHESRVGLIWATLETRPPEVATPMIREALREQPDDPDALALAARHAATLGNAEEAMRYAERCLALDGDRVEALLIRARLNRASGHPDLALADAERAASLAPHDPAALHLLALAESALGLKDRAAATSARHRTLNGHLDRLRRIQQEIDARPADPEPRCRLGRVAAEAGMIDVASRSFREALALDPNCEPARRGLAALGTSASGPGHGPRDPLEFAGAGPSTP